MCLLIDLLDCSCNPIRAANTFSIDVHMTGFHKCTSEHYSSEFWTCLEQNTWECLWHKHRFPFVFEDGIFEESWKKGFGNLSLRMLQLPLSRDVSSDQKCARRTIIRCGLDLLQQNLEELPRKGRLEIPGHLLEWEDWRKLQEN